MAGAALACLVIEEREDLAPVAETFKRHRKRMIAMNHGCFTLWHCSSLLWLLEEEEEEQANIQRRMRGPS